MPGRRGRGPYPADFKREAVLTIAQEIGVAPESLRAWNRQHEIMIARCARHLFRLGSGVMVQPHALRRAVFQSRALPVLAAMALVALSTVFATSAEQAAAGARPTVVLGTSSDVNAGAWNIRITVRSRRGARCWASLERQDRVPAAQAPDGEQLRPVDVDFAQEDLALASAGVVQVPWPHNDQEESRPATQGTERRCTG